MKTRGQDAYDRHSFTVQRERLAKQSGVRGEMAVPEAVAKDGDVLARGRLFFRQKTSAEERCDSQNAKQIGGYPCGINEFWLVLGDETRRIGIERRDAGQRFILLTHLRKFRERNRHPGCTRGAICLRDGEQLI